VTDEVILLDDRLLIEELLVGLAADARLFTTTYWYYRACRAAVEGAAGHLSGPFEQLAQPEQRRAIAALLQLRDDIALPDPRRTVPVMVDVAGRHRRLNVLNLEAVAAARTEGAAVWLSPEAARGALPQVLSAEGVAWREVAYQ
jgi:hypothetical protein